MSALESLYQQVILDHSKNPHGVGLLGGDAPSSHQLNPTCGDEITLEVHAVDGVVRELRWEGHGCSISQASASLLHDLSAGVAVSDLSERIEEFRTVMRSRGTLEPDEELFGDAIALGGVSRYVARVKCAMLAWVAAEDALSRVGR